MVRKILLTIAAVLGGITVLTVGGVVALYIANAGDYTVPPTTEDDPSLPVIELGGYRFHGETFGDPENPTVIALHGGPGGDYRSILPLAELHDDFFVVFYDQRGSGLSPRVNDEQLTLDRYIEDVDLFVDRYSPDRPVNIVGHSWGAMLAAAYVGRRPEKVARTVLAEPGFLDQDGMDHFNRETGLDGSTPSLPVMVAMTEAWAESLHVDGPDSHARQDYLLGRFFTFPIPEHPLSGYYPDGDVTNAAGKAWRFGAAASRAVQASGMDSEGNLVDLASGVEDYTGRTLFIAGSENRIIGPERQRVHMQRFNEPELAIIQGAGHTMIGEKPEETIAVIREFLGRD